MSGPRARQTGISAVELMISITIGLFILSVLSTVVVGSSINRRELEKTGRQIENGRYAMFLLTDELRHAGYFGDWSGRATAPTSVPDPCTIDDLDVLSNGLGFPVQGFAGGSAPPIACLSAADYVPNTDVLVVRRAHTFPLVESTTSVSGERVVEGRQNIMPPVRGEVYLQANTVEAALRLGNPTTFAAGALRAADNSVAQVGTGPDGGAAPVLKKANVPGWTVAGIVNTPRLAADVRKLHVEIYFIAPCSIPAGAGTSCTGSADDSGEPIPTLKRMELVASGGAPSWRIVPLVEGIEDMQLEYGMDSAASHDGSPDTYSKCEACTATEWWNVVALRVRLLARNLEPTGDHVDTKTYDLGLAGTAGPFRDGYMRHLYASMVRLNNPSGRRE